VWKKFKRWRERFNGVTKKPPVQDRVIRIKEWDLYNGAEIAEYTSSPNSDSTSSIKLSKATDKWGTSDYVVAKHGKYVIPGKTYIIDFKLFSMTWPPPTILVTGVYYSAIDKLYNDDGSYFSPSYGNGATWNWEDSVLFLQIPDDPEIRYVKIKISMLPEYSISKEIWIDDVRMSELDVDRPIVVQDKRKFDGTQVRVDELGNIEIYKNAAWHPFFMFGIYADKARDDWKVYSKQGFNTNMWASTSEYVKKGKDAQLYSNLQVGQYIVSETSWLEELENLKNNVKQIIDDRLMKEVIFYYIDNEFYDVPTRLCQVVDVIRKMDKNVDGDRIHPIYMLNSPYGLARKYNNLVEVTGTYVARDRTARSTVHNFTGLQINENQKLPAVVAQINRGVGKNFKAILFGAIAKGAKGMGFWRDGGSGINVTEAEWWNEFPDIVAEIKQMMPLIRATHTTTWKVKCDHDAVIVGGRSLKSEYEGGYDLCHLIIANPSNRKILAKFTLSNMPYTSSIVFDYFRNDVSYGDVEDDETFQLVLNPHATRVIKLI
jgi:hypothetical protein